LLNMFDFYFMLSATRHVTLLCNSLMQIWALVLQ